VVSRLVDIGQNISVGTPLLILADFDPLLARIHVPAKEFKKLKPDQTVELVLDSNQTRLAGRIKLVSPTIDPASGTIKITVEIPEYPPETRPGDFAEVRIVTERRHGSTLVPKIAVVTDRGDQVVYVAADSTAERRVVEVGFQDDDHAEILSGLDAGEQVVVKGQRTLKHGAPIKILEDDMPEPEPQGASPRGRRGGGRRRGR
jgi:membrane fusion protein (multidrug efflux system)